MSRHRRALSPRPARASARAAVLFAVLVIVVALIGLRPALASANSTPVTLRPTLAKQRLKTASPAVRKTVDAVDVGDADALFAMYRSMRRKGAPALIRWALALQSVVRAHHGNYLHTLYWVVKASSPARADRLARDLIGRGVAVGPDSGHYENLEYLDASAPLPPLPARVAATPIGFWVDAFAAVTYDMSYRPHQKGRLSRFLQITYHDGTRLDIDMRLISDNSDPASSQSVGRMYLGPAKRLYPLRMDWMSTPNLWAAKRAAQAEMDRFNEGFLALVSISTSATVNVLPLPMAVRVQPAVAASAPAGRPSSTVAKTSGKPAPRAKGRARTSEKGGFGRNTVGAAERPIPKFTRAMKSRAEIIKKGDQIHKVDKLVARFGGKAREWKKMKTWTADGREIHWYEHPGIGKVGVKWDGFPDPF